MNVTHQRAGGDDFPSETDPAAGFVACDFSLFGCLRDRRSTALSSVGMRNSPAIEATCSAADS